MAERLIVISLTQMQDFDQDFIYVMIRAVTDFLAITTIHSENTCFWNSPSPFLKTSFQEIPSRLRKCEQLVVVNWFSCWWMHYQVWWCRRYIFSPLVLCKRGFCLCIVLSKILLTCNFKISARQHVKSGFGMGKLSFGVVFTVLVKYGLFLHCCNLSCQGQESLLLLVVSISTCSRAER